MGGASSCPRDGGLIDARELAQRVLDIALDKKALDPSLLEVGDLVGYADYFVVVSARSARQVRAIAEHVRRVLRDEHGQLSVGTEGMRSCKWVLVDYDDVVLHVFQEGSRAFYDLEGLWSDAPRLPVPEQPEHEVEEPLFTMP